MPELPEVETIRRQLDPVVRGRSVVAAGGHPSDRFAAAGTVVGVRLGPIRRRGKYLIVPTDDARELIVHLGMTGVLGVTDDPDAPDAPQRRFTRAWWLLDDARTLTFDDQRRFGRVAVVPRGCYGDLPTLAALGPEPLGPDFTARAFHRALARHRAPVKATLLTQRVVAGVGNIYADEALWRARINPVARRVGPGRAARLRDAIVAVLSEAIDHGGTRLRDYRTPAGDTGAHQWHLDCYGRAGEACPRCGTVLRARRVAGRGTTWCPRCQAR